LDAEWHVPALQHSSVQLNGENLYMTTTTASVESTFAVRPRLSGVQQAMLSLYWFSVSAHWAAILNILLPQQALAIGGDAFKGRTLGIILAFGAVVSMVVAPVFGALSDRVPTRWGRRHPWLVVGTLLNIVGLIVLAYIPATPQAIVPYVLAFMGIELFNNLATAPYSALIPDVVPPEQRGSASGWMGLMTMLGSFVGTAVGFVLAIIGIAGAYWFIAVVMLVGMLGTVLTIKEPPVTATSPPFRWGGLWRGMLSPFRSRNFAWVFWTRFLVVMGTFTVQQFLQFYMKDVIGAPFRFFGITLATDPAAATSFFLLTLLIGAIASSLVAGRLSDRYGRKLMVYLSGALQTAVVIVFIFYGSFELAVLLGLVFGLGYGAYQSVDWALATDVLPNLDDYAKDMGVWHVSITLPQVLATPVAGFLLDRFQIIGQRNGIPDLGYTVIFALAALFFIFGTVLVRQVRGVR
jgi:MFS family permease